MVLCDLFMKVVVVELWICGADGCGCGGHIGGVIVPFAALLLAVVLPSVYVIMLALVLVCIVCVVACWEYSLIPPSLRTVWHLLAGEGGLSTGGRPLANRPPPTHRCEIVLRLWGIGVHHAR